MCTERPRISILLCNYNDAKYLPESLGAICRQTVLPDEVIVVDDGSIDDSVDVIESFAAQYPFVRVLKNDRNRGLLFSIRRALDAASMDYIVWAAADDRLLPSFLERSLAALVRYPGAGVCFSRLATFDDRTCAVREYIGSDTVDPAFDMGEEPHFLTAEALRARLTKSYLWMSGNTVLARREAVLEAGGFRPDLQWHADWFAYYVVALRYGACLVPETLAHMRERPATFSRLGMAKPGLQFPVLRALAGALRDPAYGDVAPVVRARPCLLSPFGHLMLAALASTPRSWPLAWRYLHWTIDRLASSLERTAVPGKRRRTLPAPVRLALRLTLRLSAGVLDALTPSAWKICRVPAAIDTVHSSG